jgi:putative heme transporter
MIRSSERPSTRRFPMLRVVGLAVSAVLAAVMFRHISPQLADLASAWVDMRAMTWRELGVLALAAAANVGIAATVLLAATPGLTYRQAVVVTETSTAVSNTVPGGTAMAIGLIYTILGSWGFSKSRSTLSITVSAAWNGFVKLAMAVVAAGLLMVRGDASGARIVAGAIAAGALVAALALFAVILSSDDFSQRAGDAAGRLSLRIRRRLSHRPTDGWGHATAKFRGRVIAVVSRSWVQLTVSALAAYVSLYLVLLVTLRAVGVANDEVDWIDVLAVLAVVRVVTMIPLSPGGIGIVELGLIAGLTSAGGNRAEVVAAVLVYRLLTYVLPIVLGFVTYIYWLRKTSWLGSAPPLDPRLTPAAWRSAEATV